MPIAPRVDESLVRILVADQFPEWANLPIRPVDIQGWDNRSFRLGDRLLVRMPSDAAYAPHVEKEQHWLPFLARSLPMEVPSPVAMGRPGRGYPWKWSIYRFIEGEPATGAADLEALARDLAPFLLALHRIDARAAPSPGNHNFHRGGPLSHYDGEARAAIRALGGRIGARKVIAAWEAALASPWTRPAVWIHGDIALGNLLLRDGRLRAVIDFGNLAAGDPACDLAFAWTALSGSSRVAFQRALDFDEGTWMRARGWALWKGLVVAAGHASTNAPELSRPLDIVAATLSY